MFIEYKGKSPRVHSSAFVAPTAVLIGDVEVCEEASIWFGTVIRGDNGFILRGNLDPTTMPGVLPAPGLAETVGRLGPQLEELSIEQLRHQAAGGGPV